MQLLKSTFVLSLVAGLVAAQSATTSSSSPTTTGASSTPSSSSSTPATTSAASTTSTSSATVVVNQDGSAQFTAINAAVSYAQAKAVPTVYVNAGTYNEAVSVIGSAAVTIVGETSSSSDYTQNQVIISTSGVPMTIGTNAVLNTVWRNINFISTAVTSSAYAVSLRGTKNAFYDCQIVSSGAQAVYSTYGITLIANSYVESTTQTFAGYLGMYVYGSTITATSSGALLVYSKGITGTNSQIAFDTCTITGKAGSTNTGVYLAAPNNNGSQAIWRNTYLGSFITPKGVYSTAATYTTFYGEYATTGPGSYCQNSASRLPQDYLMTTAQLSSWSIDQVFGNSFSPYQTSDTTWIDSSVLAAIQNSDSAVVSQNCGASSSSSVATSSSSATASVSASSTSSTVTSAASTGSSTSSTSSISATSVSASMNSTTTSISASASASASSASCPLPTSVPSTAKTVGPSGSCANYTSIAAAVADLPNDSTTQYVYILAGTYSGRVSIARSGATVFRGASNSTLDQTSNQVTITQSGGLLSGSGSSEPYSTFQTTQYNAKKLAFYNINFVNSYPETNNYIAIAMDIKAQQVGFYSCGFESSAGTFLANYGSFYLAGCRIEGAQDFFWGYGAAYVYNSIIVTNEAGYSIAAQSYQSSYGGSQFVFDHSAIVPSSASIGQSSTYLGRDYTTSARVAYTNSFLDAHIKPVGWLISSSTTNVTFVEAGNSGPGASTSSRPSNIQILSDSSAYSTANVLGDISWIDTAAIPAFSSFPDSVFGSTTSSSSSLSSPSTTPTVSANSTSSTLPTATTNATASATSTAACPTDTLVVNQTPANNCQYANISAAVAALANDGLAKTIMVSAGTYTEQIAINRAGQVTLKGATTFANDFTKNAVIVKNSYGVSTSAGQDELTPVLNSKKSGLAVYNINFQNTFPQTKNYAALAADFYGSNMAFYGCSFIGFQDTLLLNQGAQVLSNCYIEGSVDFIWGFSTAFMHGCYIAANTPGASVCAMSRSSATAAGGYVIDSSLITYTSTYGSAMGQTYLGRPYSNFSRVVYTNSYLDSNINSAGWSVWQTTNPQTSNVTFAEYNNVGPSSSTTNRASFSTQLTATQAQAYTLGNWIGDTSWIDMTAYNLAPSYTWSNNTATTPTSTTNSTSSSATPTASSTCGHPTSGTIAPVGAVIVDASNATSGSYPSLTAALAALPSDSTCQTIFMMPGTYVEQANVNRPGQTRIIGYQSGSPGEGYAANQVTVSFSSGLSVSPLPSGASDSQTATITTTSSGIAFYNVNFINTDNLDGSLASYVTLAASIYGSHIGFYGCSFVGWQDTLLTGSTNGYQYYESCYIEGAIDFIWGYSAAYYKGCTIAAKRKSSAITAASRASSSAIGAYVFDQCLVTAAPGYAAAINSASYLGRPYSMYAKVVYKYSYLDSIIAPAGWKVWSATDPRTDFITFAEYNNTGPGNWENNAAAREAFGNATLLTSDTYPLASIMDTTTWIDMTYFNSITTPVGTSGSTGSTNTTTTTNSTTTAASSTAPGAGDYIVSQTAIANETTYPTISDAITAISGISSSIAVTVFIYPGTYDEQLTYNRSGTTIFRGYSENTDDNTKNQVIIQNSHGVNTQADESNSDSATLYSRAKYIQMYNIDLNNVFGTADDYASLGFAIGNNGYAGFYGCSIRGNQDTFDLNSGTSVFAYNTLVEGSIDFIWGAGSAYFLKSTIVPNYNSGCMTADKRATNTTVGGLVFDQCTVAAASGVSAGSIYLGRPYNQYARVAWVETYLDASIAPAGWSIWSTSAPQTDGVLFGEYHNTGPGSSTAARASFSEQLSDTDVVQFELANFFSTVGTAWINMTYVHTTPFVAGVYPNVTTSSTSLASSSTISSSSVAVSTVFTTVSVTDSFTVPGATVTAIVTKTSDVPYTDTPSTVFTTKISTEKDTTTTTISQNPVTVYSTVTDTVGSSQTITPSPVIVTKFTTFDTTVGSSVTVSPAPVMVTKYSTVSTTVGSIVTVTPEASTVVKSSTVTSAVDDTSTVAGSTVTQISVATVYGTITTQPAAAVITVTSSRFSTVEKITTPKGTTVTSTVSTVIVPGSTTTVTPKASTSSVTVYSTGTKTSTVTTTLSCTPLAKRELSYNRFPARAVGASKTTAYVYTTVSVTVTAKPTTVTTTSFSTVAVEQTAKPVTSTITSVSTSIAKVITATIIGPTTTSVVTAATSISAVTTLKATTSTITVIVTDTSTIAGTTSLKGSTTTVSDVVTVTSTVDGTTTLKAATTTTTAIVAAYKTSTVKVTVPAVTSTSYSTITSNSVVTLPRSTNTITTIKQGTTTVTSTVAAPSVEVDKTVTSTGSKVTFTGAVSTVLKTTTVKTTTTIYATSTKYAKSATTCAA